LRNFTIIISALVKLYPEYQYPFIFQLIGL